MPRNKFELFLTIAFVAMMLVSFMMYRSISKTNLKQTSALAQVHNRIADLGYQGLAELCHNSPGEELIDGMCKFRATNWISRDAEIEVIEVKVEFWQADAEGTLWPGTKRTLESKEGAAEAHVFIELKGNKYTRSVSDVLYFNSPQTQ